MLALALAAGHVPAAGAGFRPSRACASGTTIFRDGNARLFRIPGTIDGEPARRHYVCSDRIRTPKRFNETSPATDEQLGTFRRNGPRVAYVDTLAGGESFDQLLGTVDLRNGRRRLSGLRSRDEGPAVLAVAPDRRGGVACLQDALTMAPSASATPARARTAASVSHARARV